MLWMCEFYDITLRYLREPSRYSTNNYNYTPILNYLGTDYILIEIDWDIKITNQHSHVSWKILAFAIKCVYKT